MPQERTIQATIFEVFVQHEIGCELKAMSQWLDGFVHQSRGHRAVEPQGGAAFQPVLFGAGQQGLVDRFPGLGAKRRDRPVQHRLLWRPPQRQTGKGAKRGGIFKVKG